MVSQRAQGIQPSGIRKMFERVASLEHPIDFSIGQPHFEVPAEIQRAAVAAIESGKNRYTVTQGIPELNDRIAAALAVRLGQTPEQTLVTSGVSGGLLLSLLTLLDPGDEILLPDPYFVLYRVTAELVGARPRYYNMYPDFRLRREALEAAVTERTKVLLLNSPSNPTGAVLSAEELQVAAAFARDHNLWVLSDEIYEAFTYDQQLPSVAQWHDRAVVLGGFSKTYGVPGWRLGYAAGPSEVLEPMTTMQQFTYVCANTPAQHAGVVAFDVDIEPYVRAYRKKRDRVCEVLDTRFDLVRPGGSFYAFPHLPAGMTGARFVEKAFEKELLIVPGNAFSAQDSHFRISYAVPDEVLERGLEVLLSLADDPSP